MSNDADMEFVSPSRYRDALVSLIKEMNYQMTTNKWSMEQRLALGRAERWAQEKLKQADDAGRPPKKSKRRSADDDD